MPLDEFPPWAQTKKALSGRRLLLVESNLFLAMDLAEALRRQGAEVIGPAALVSNALSLMEAHDRLDGAVMEVGLDGKFTYAVADALRRKQIPFVFITGYDAWAVSKAYADAPRFEKPVNTDDLATSLAQALWGVA